MSSQRSVSSLHFYQNIPIDRLIKLQIQTHKNIELSMNRWTWWVNLRLGLPNTLARPKSANFNRPFSPTSRLLGFISLKQRQKLINNSNTLRRKSCVGVTCAEPISCDNKLNLWRSSTYNTWYHQEKERCYGRESQLPNPSAYTRTRDASSRRVETRRWARRCEGGSALLRAWSPLGPWNWRLLSGFLT